MVGRHSGAARLANGTSSLRSHYVRSRAYAEYLKLDELLSLQQPKSDGPEHDEMLFIVIHQVYELWFKQMLHELDRLGARFKAGDSAGVLQTLKRILTILKTLVAQIDVLETMTPLEFLSFRDRLASASGFESCQFRELEFALGMKQPATLERFADGSPEHQRLAERLRSPSLWDYFVSFLVNQGMEAPTQASSDTTPGPTQENKAVQEHLIQIYRTDQTLSQVCERLVDLDEGIQEWRYRHVKMVQRTIGTKRGTGGSSGAEYLQATLFKPLFPDLWAIRSEL